MIGHGVCGCAICYKAGLPPPRRPWVIRKIERAQYGGLRLQGINLCFPPHVAERHFSWSFTFGQNPFGTSSYDATNAVIEPAALLDMERRADAQPVRP